MAMSSYFLMVLSMLRAFTMLMVLVFTTLFSSPLVQAQALAPGLLDPGFGTGGAKLLTLAQAPGGGEFRAIRTQPDAKIVAGGWVWNAGVTVATGVVARFTATGDLDTGFGLNGLVTLPFIFIVSLPRVGDGSRR